MPSPSPFPPLLPSPPFTSSEPDGLGLQMLSALLCRIAGDRIASAVVIASSDPCSMNVEELIVAAVPAHNKPMPATTSRPFAAVVQSKIQNWMLDHPPFHRLFNVVDDQMNAIVGVDQFEPVVIDDLRSP